MSSDSQLNVLWTPQPKQIEALERSEFEILYGGARGGGKTDAGISWMAELSDEPQFRGLVLRRTSEDLKDWIDRANQLYSRLSNSAVKVGNPPEFHFSSGAIIRTGHLNDEDAYTKYQGHEYQRLLIEELTQIPSETQYIKLLSSVRNTKLPGIDPQVFLTTNPGGKGHMWVKKRFIDPAPPGTTMWYSAEIANPDTKEKMKVWRSKIFVQATMDDNPILFKTDPGYVANIEALKDEDYETYMAWRFGDWDRFSGQVFGEFDRKKHVIDPLIPQEGTHYLWMDWGYSDHHPTSFSAYLSTVVPAKLPDGQSFHRIITYQEFCGNRKDPEEWARIIFESCRKMGVTPKLGLADPAMVKGKKDTAKLPGDLMMDEWKRLNGGKKWVQVIKGNNSRVGRTGGWATMHKWLSSPIDILPYWMITKTCTNLIRTLPMLVYDEHDVEDVDTEQEDHPADACRYGLMDVRFTAIKPGSYTARASEKKRYLPTDSEGYPAIDPKTFFGSLS